MNKFDNIINSVTRLCAVAKIYTDFKSNIAETQLDKRFAKELTEDEVRDFVFKDLISELTKLREMLQGKSK